MALDLARRAGITVPTWRLEHVADRTALLLRRFDREGEIRIPYLSATHGLHARDVARMASAFEHDGTAA